MPRRLAIFIDGSNLYHALRTAYSRADLDFRLLASRLCGDRDLVRAYYYNAPVAQQENPTAYREQQRFFAALQSTPYFELRLGRLVNRAGVLVEKGVDVRLAVDMVRMGHLGIYDTAILVSGDGDFADAVQAVKDMGKHVECAFPGTGLADNLKRT